MRVFGARRTGGIAAKGPIIWGPIGDLLRLVMEPHRLPETEQGQQAGNGMPLSHRKHLPVGVIAVPIPAVTDSPKISRAKLVRRMAQTGVLPVIDRKKRLIGFLEERDWIGTTGLSMGKITGGTWAVLPKEAGIEDAIERFGATNQSFIPIVDAQGRYTGECASRSQLFRLLNGLLRPPRAGGLATPLGVYMTSGYHMAGSGWKGLVATGVMFGAVISLLDRLWMVMYSVMAAFYPAISGLDSGNYMVLQTGCVLITLFALLRLSPISGLHAAEHMTINAIENDLELTAPVVRTQPREHLRCGTNLMVLLGGIQMIAVSLFFLHDRISPLGMFLYAAIWMFMILKFWRPAGLWLQRHFTTKPPSPAQLESGLRAGRELLEKFAAKPHPMPSFGRRLWGSGLPLMFAAFLLSAGLFGYILQRLGI
jgi:CBS domain-containing protein